METHFRVSARCYYYESLGDAGLDVVPVHSLRNMRSFIQNYIFTVLLRNINGQ